MSRSNLTLADMAREMRQRASFPDLTETMRDLLTTWAEALERMNGDMTTEYERLCRDYDMAMEALKQNEQVLKRLGTEVDRLRAENAALWPLVEALAMLPDKVSLTVQTYQYHEAIEVAQRITDAAQQARALLAQRRQVAPER